MKYAVMFAAGKAVLELQLLVVLSAEHFTLIKMSCMTAFVKKKKHKTVFNQDCSLFKIIYNIYKMYRYRYIHVLLICIRSFQIS